MGNRSSLQKKPAALVSSVRPTNAGMGGPAAQAKLTMNEPGDIYEQEADRVAEKVTAMADTQVQRTCACGGSCPDCQAKEREEGSVLQAKHDHHGRSADPLAPEIVHEVLRSPGQTLDPATRRFMEPRFGHDFGR